MPALLTIEGWHTPSKMVESGKKKAVWVSLVISNVNLFCWLIWVLMTTAGPLAALLSQLACFPSSDSFIPGCLRALSNRDWWLSMDYIGWLMCVFRDCRVNRLSLELDLIQSISIDNSISFRIPTILVSAAVIESPTNFLSCSALLSVFAADFFSILRMVCTLLSSILLDRAVRVSQVSLISSILFLILSSSSMAFLSIFFLNLLIKDLISFSTTSISSAFKF